MNRKQRFAKVSWFVFGITGSGLNSNLKSTPCRNPSPYRSRLGITGIDDSNGESILDITFRVEHADHYDKIPFFPVPLHFLNLILFDQVSIDYENGWGEIRICNKRNHSLVKFFEEFVP